jgi:aldehyde:ferredoxin oxidoreductase
MEMLGYAGKILKINLTDGHIVKENLDPGMAKNFVGAIGFSSKLLYENVKPNTDALSPGNALIASSSPFSGTGLIGTNKTDWTSKSPITGLAQTATSGDFGTHLKWAGYDSMVITGKAARPSYITIFDDEVTIKDAGDLWGKDNYEAADELWDRYGDDCTIFSIGTAGEKMARISMAYTNKQASAGRKGSGAVVGSKNIKAIVVRGTKGIKLAHPKDLMSISDKSYDQFLQDSNLKAWMELGTTIAIEQYGKEGKAAWKNWRESYPADNWVNRFGVKEYLKVRDIALPCTLCPLSCRVVQTIKQGEFAGLTNLQSCNMGAILSYGAKFDLLNYNQVIKCHDTANRLGIDTNDFCCLMDFLMELQEKGIIDTKTTDGLKLERNLDTALTWLHKIAKREGFGSVIADGYPGLFASLGEKLIKYTVQRKGSSLDFDPRGLFGTEGFGVAVGLTGPHATFALGPLVIGGRTPDQLRRYCSRIGVSEKEMDKIFTDPSGFNIAQMTRYVERWNILLDIMGICSRPPLARLYSFSSITELYGLITGIKLKPEDMLAASERCANILKLFNISQGATRKDDYLPERYYFEPFYLLGKETWLTDYYNTNRITKEKIEELIGDYYEARGWDNNGVPSDKTLADLQLKK